MFIKPLVNCLKTLVNQYNSSLTTKPKILHDSKNQDWGRYLKLVKQFLKVGKCLSGNG